MKFSTLQRIVLPPHLTADAAVAEHGGAIQKVNDREIRLLRPFRLVEMTDEEIAQWKRPARPIVPLAFLLLLLMFGAATGRGAGVGALPASGVARAALPLADVSNADMGSWVIVMFAVCAGVGSVAGVVALFRPQPALHKQFAARDDHDRDIKEIKETIGAMRRDFETWSSAHYDARRRMHKKINHLSSAMAYLAGTLEKTEPNTAARLRSLIDKADDEGDDE